MKLEIFPSELKTALVTTFASFGWDTTNWEVWSGIHTDFADRLWDNLNKAEADVGGYLSKNPKFRYKKLFWIFYIQKKI